MRPSVSPSRMHSRSRIREVGEQHVARVVAERVVDQLEAVEVDEEHREPALVPLRLRERLLQALAEHRAVEEPGERVVARDELEIALGLLARDELADVGARRSARPAIDAVVGARALRGAKNSITP